VNVINCSIKGCTNFFQTEEAVHPQATYQCRLHTTKAPDTVRFQEYANDKDLAVKRGQMPVGTTHIPKARYKHNREEADQEAEIIVEESK
jgi:hypothetical protein